MKSNLKFLLALGNTKLVMLNTCGQNVFYSKNSTSHLKKDLTKITNLLQTRY